MPKPLKNSTTKAKRKPPSDPNRAAHAVLKHLERLDPDPSAPAAPSDFQAAYKAHMAKLGAKGGRVSGAKRMENLTEPQRKEIAKKAAAARWKKRPGQP